MSGASLLVSAEGGQRKGGRGDGGYGRLLLAAGGARQALPQAGRAGVRGGVRLLGKRLHPLLQQDPCGETGETETDVSLVLVEGGL